MSLQDTRRAKALKRFWWANGALLFLGLVFVGVGLTVLLVGEKSANSSSVESGTANHRSNCGRSAVADLLVACGVVSAMFVIQNAILAAFHTGMAFERQVPISSETT